MGSVLQGNANEVVPQVMVMRVVTDAHQIMSSQELCERNGLLLWRLIPKFRVLAAKLLCNTVKMTGHLAFLAAIAVSDS